MWASADKQVLMCYWDWKGRTLGGISFGGGTGFPTASMQKETPRRIAETFGFIVKAPGYRSSSRPKYGDETIVELSLKVCWETHRPDYWTKALNWFNEALDRPTVWEDWTTVAQRPVGESDKLFFRATSQGQFYVSTANDREHMIHADLLNDDPNLVANAAKICQDHWADWEKKVDEMAKTSAPD
jgi:hypothetical protein